MRSNDLATRLTFEKYDYGLVAEAAKASGMTLPKFVVEAARLRALAVLSKPRLIVDNQSAEKI